MENDLMGSQENISEFIIERLYRLLNNLNLIDRSNERIVLKANLMPTKEILVKVFIKKSFESTKKPLAIFKLTKEN